MIKHGTVSAATLAPTTFPLPDLSVSHRTPPWRSAIQTCLRGRGGGADCPCLSLKMKQDQPALTAQAPLCAHWALVVSDGRESRAVSKGYRPPTPSCLLPAAGFAVQNQTHLPSAGPASQRQNETRPSNLESQCVVARNALN